MSVAFCNFYNHFQNVPDPRVNRGENYPLLEMILIALCATICGADSWVDVERFGKAKLSLLRKIMPLALGIPSHDTFGRVFASLDSVAFYAALHSWTQELAADLTGQTVAIDGKTLRGSHDGTEGKSPLHSVTAWACGLRLCLGIHSVDANSNEIPAVRELINMLDLEGSTVTLDALHCQKETIRNLHAKDADYLVTVKGNQPTLQAELDAAIVQSIEGDNPKLRRHVTKETNRGREETREVLVMPVPRTKAFKGWDGIQTIGVVVRTRVVNGHEQIGLSTFITSLPCRVRDISKRLRDHWKIENELHQVLDVTFREDASRIRKGTGPEITSVFRRLALNILKQDTTIQDNIRGKRVRCGWCDKTLLQLLARFSNN